MVTFWPANGRSASMMAYFSSMVRRRCVCQRNELALGLRELALQAGDLGGGAALRLLDLPAQAFHRRDAAALGLADAPLQLGDLGGVALGGLIVGAVQGLDLGGEAGLRFHGREARWRGASAFARSRGAAPRSRRDGAPRPRASTGAKRACWWRAHRARPARGAAYRPRCAPWRYWRRASPRPVRSCAGRTRRPRSRMRGEGGAEDGDLDQRVVHRRGGVGAPARQILTARALGDRRPDRASNSRNDRWSCRPRSRSRQP